MLSCIRHPLLLPLSVLTSLLASVAAAPAQSLERIGSERQVNVHTTGSQEAPDVAFTADGGFVVVWSSGSYSGGTGPDGSETAIRGRRFLRDGSPASGEFQVNSWTTGQQYLPSVAASPSGGFVVVWSSFGSSGSDTSFSAVLGQRFAGDGQPSGGEFQVNSSTLGYQTTARVTYLDDGSFVAVFAGENAADGDGLGIVAQRFSATGTKIGDEVAINAVTTLVQRFPAVAAVPGGGFVVVWQNEYDPPDNWGNVSIRLADASGSLVDGEFQVNAYTTLRQWHPDVVAQPEGDFIVLFESDGSFELNDGDPSRSIQRRFTTVPPPEIFFVEQQVNTYTTGQQRKPRVVLDRDGDPVVVWQSEGSRETDPDDSIQIRHGADPEFQVNTYTTGGQNDPAMATDGRGRFVVVWTSDGSFGDDTDTDSVQLQVLTLPVFVDGFESGTVSAWSSSLP